MAIHEEVLTAAQRIGAERKDWTFTPNEIVRALPHLNPSSVRTHVTSRCCENAPRHHAHKWPYFARVGHGLYKVLPAVRGKRRSPPDHAREAPAGYGASAAAPPRDTIHGVLSRSAGYFVAECLEIAVTTQGRTLDETLANLQEAIALHLEGEDRAALGFSRSLRLLLSYETQVRVVPA